MRILLVEDEPRLSEALTYILKKNNHIVDPAYDGLTGEDLAESDLYDLIILDRMLPGKEGLEVLKTIRAHGICTPVLFLTAKDSIEDRIDGLDHGADDYMIKPFSKEELLARVRALGRRPSNTLLNDTFEIGDFLFSPLKREIAVGNVMIKLSSKEAQMLEILIKNRNMVVTKDLLLEKIWGFQSPVEANNVEVYLSYLRKKLGSLTQSVVIETIRGSGYCLKEVE